MCATTPRGAPTEAGQTTRLPIRDISRDRPDLPLGSQRVVNTPSMPVLHGRAQDPSDTVASPIVAGSFVGVPSLRRSLLASKALFSRSRSREVGPLAGFCHGLGTSALNRENRVRVPDPALHWPVRLLGVNEAWPTDEIGWKFTGPVSLTLRGAASTPKAAERHRRSTSTRRSAFYFRGFDTPSSVAKPRTGP